jgi:hypothetical protein
VALVLLVQRLPALVLGGVASQTLLPRCIDDRPIALGTEPIPLEHGILLLREGGQLRT